MALNPDIIRGTFEILKPHADEFADKFYQYLWSDYPESKALFENAKMENQKQALINSLVYIVDHIEKTEDLVSYLKKMGSRHNNYGTQEEHYEIVGATIIKTLKFLFKRMWSDEAQEQWLAAYGVISSTMIEGSKEGQKEEQKVESKEEEEEVPTFEEELKAG